ncbi:DNA gyrase subunit A [Acetatifactor aquisgranensis]|uniref:DNA gyrase subunit A n=1 Tax=Acetatifactor aquisgranensis TaxID=2941233 RepID=UPI00203A71AD|nr:DNA gyrase subunit A [Acetatifactor aquisgranensis]
MRCNQVRILIERFGKYVPEDYPGDVQRISVYVDDFKSIYAALSKAYALAVDELAEYEQIGVRADVSTNEYSKSDYREMHGKLPKGRLRYEDDDNWEYYDSRLELCQDYIWAFEHSAEILEVIKGSKDKRDMIVSLKEAFDLSDYQVKKLLQIRFDMLTEQEYKSYQEEAAKMKERRNGIPDLPYDDESRERYARTQIGKLDRQIEEAKAHLLAAENYPEIIAIMENADGFHEYAETMREKFGFSQEQSRYFQHMSIQDFDRKKREETRKKLDWLMNSREMYEKDLRKEEPAREPKRD